MKRIKTNQLHFFLYFVDVLLPRMPEIPPPALDQAVNMVLIEKKRGRKKQEVVREDIDKKTVIEVDGIRTTIEVYEKTIYGEVKFVTKIERIYRDGQKYEEPEHLWGTPEQARLDAKDWTYLAQKTDW